MQSRPHTLVQHNKWSRGHACAGRAIDVSNGAAPGPPHGRQLEAIQRGARRPQAVDIVVEAAAKGRHAGAAAAKLGNAGFGTGIIRHTPSALCAMHVHTLAMLCLLLLLLANLASLPA